MNIDEQMAQKGFCVFDITQKNINNERVSTNYNTIGLCYSGESRGEINLEPFTLTAGDRFCMHHVMLAKMTSVTPDFKATILLVTDKFSWDVMAGVETELIDSLMQHPVAKIGDNDEAKIIKNFLENLRIYQHQEQTKHYYPIVGAIFRCMMVAMSELEHYDTKVNAKANYSMADIYFRDFIALIYKFGQKEHEVNFYADKLNITPKYLSEITKQKSRHKAKEVISAILISNIKREIAISGKSLKTLAYEFCFADQSSLGKFFHKETGMSPSDFRKKSYNYEAELEEGE
jgi:YesN/AraC family two-component response regulator